MNSNVFKIELVYYSKHVNLEFFFFSFRQLNLKKVLVSGGHMEYKVDPEHLKENGGQKICILAMDGAGKVSIYLCKSLVILFSVDSCRGPDNVKLCCYDSGFLLTFASLLVFVPTCFWCPILIGLKY